MARKVAQVLSLLAVFIFLARKVAQVLSLLADFHFFGTKSRPSTDPASEFMNSAVPRDAQVRPSTVPASGFQANPALVWGWHRRKKEFYEQEPG